MMTPVRFGAVKLESINKTNPALQTLRFKLDGEDKNRLQHTDYQDTLELSFRSSGTTPEISYTVTVPPDENPHPWASNTWEDLATKNEQVSAQGPAFQQIGQLLRKFAETASPEDKASVAGLFKQYGQAVNGVMANLTRQIETLTTKAQSWQQEKTDSDALVDILK